MPISLEHNLDSQKFRWLWMKYVSGVNDAKHCTNCIRGKYGKLLSKHNASLNESPRLVLDEQPADSFARIYICGVIKKGYPKSNYAHNLHAVIRPSPGSSDDFAFENWQLRVNNGIFELIPAESDLPLHYQHLPAEFTTCRIFRWAVCSSLNLSQAGESAD